MFDTNTQANSLGGQKENDFPLINSTGVLVGGGPEIFLNKISAIANSEVIAINIGAIALHANSQNGQDSVLNVAGALSGEMFNSDGRPTMTFEDYRLLSKRVKEAALGRLIIMTVTPSVTLSHRGNAVDEAIRLVNMAFEEGQADYVGVNISNTKPTTNGMRPYLLGHSVNDVDYLVTELDREFGADGHRLGLSLPQYLTYIEREKARAIGEIIADSKSISFITTPNLIPSMIPEDHHGQRIFTSKDKSGKEQRKRLGRIGSEQTIFWNRQLKDTEIISKLGVYDGEEVAFRKILGACLVSSERIFTDPLDLKAKISEVKTAYERKILINKISSHH
jgi:hypothetical protein